MGIRLFTGRPEQGNTEGNQMTTNAAVWLRVSGDEQTSDNQEPDLARFTSHHGYTVTRTYRISDSAWKQGPAYRQALADMLQDARSGHFSVLCVWSLDRIVRSGSEADKSASEEALALIRHLTQNHVTLVSMKESWLSASPEIASVLISFAAWVAESESKRRSERVRAGMARAKSQGKRVGGRQVGATDKKTRRTDGYITEQARRRQAMV